MSGPDASALRGLHRLLEHYTPDGTVGRLLLGLTALVGGPLLLFGGIAALSAPTSFLAFLIGVLMIVTGVPLAVVGIVCLWPVYLSLIGNVESPEAYPDGSRIVSRPTNVGDDVGNDAEATLKRRYAEGDISREEFEEQLDALLDADERGRDRTRRGAVAGGERETESAR
ncbi:SHOCT domain-containing protein [Halorarum salinum]|uniref:SHOCT domain-containing protein n=1 Tax=Halorarum salinum TaxID=2743089 RepID=A0A7D5QA90_9EURY|nr:SHOCT domain-containing protein [Halobaculum salinum]QLG61578.1 SHOCT domain-containing protein [Halobaculum salinum]